VVNDGNVKSFIAKMKGGDEYARHGFRVLEKRDDADEYFDIIADAGFFDPQRVPEPRPAGEPGYITIPYWDALDYLHVVAKLAVQRNKTELVQKVLNVVRTVSRFRNERGEGIKNHAVYWRFADILGLMPLPAISLDDMDLIPGWFNVQHNTGMIATSLAKELLPRLLASEDSNDRKKTESLLRHLTELTFPNESDVRRERGPRTIVEDYWLKETLDKYAKRLGTKLGSDALHIFEDRLEELAAHDHKSLGSWVDRPAIEEHEQNRFHESAFNRIVDGARDTLNGWIETGDNRSIEYVRGLLTYKLPILQRIAIAAINSHYGVLRTLVPNLLRPIYFGAEHNHEMYQLLLSQFGKFTADEKAATFRTIQSLRVPENDGDPIPERALKRIHRKWLTAISGNGYMPAESALAELNSDDSLGPLSPHPDLGVYFQGGWAVDKTPYTAPEIVGFAQTGKLVEKLNAFKQDGWDGPSVRGLMAALKEATKSNLQMFVDLLPTLLRVHVTYQHAVIDGLKEKWESTPEPSPDVDWLRCWSQFFEYLELAIASPEFWARSKEPLAEFTPNETWFISLVSDTMRAGTNKDSRAFDKRLLPAELRVLRVFLQRAKGEDEPNYTDAMTHAINNARGKTVEALVSYALRVCRVADQDTGSHNAIWQEMEPIFSAELERAVGGNFEFSTLMGCYVANLAYISGDWLAGNIQHIFPIWHASNFNCAIEGYAYSPAQKDVYQLMVKSGIVDHALKQELPGKHARESVLERIALAYLWGDEELDGPRFKYLFDGNRDDDLYEIANYFWRSRSAELKDEHVTRILAFWRKAVDSLQGRKATARQIYSNLSRLACFLPTISKEDLPRLLIVARNVYEAFDINNFVEELDRLAGEAPAMVAEVLEALANEGREIIDFEHRLEPLVRKLDAAGQHSRALSISNKLRNLDGFIELFQELSKR